MEKDQKTLHEAIRLSLPNMLKNEQALEAVIEILYDNLFSGTYEGNVVESLTGKGSYGEFPIDINEFHGIFWITAPDFDDHGYFLNKEDAIAFAEDLYAGFISNYINNEDVEEIY